MKLELNTISTRRRKVSNERLAICRECPELEPTLVQCRICGCFMKGKTMFMNSECPLNKWGKHIEDEDGTSS